MARLRRSDTSEPGLTRVRRGGGFEYRRVDGSLVRASGQLARIQGLGIPPAWRDVWISTDERGHIQATGTDDAGRKQYLYHPDWRGGQDRAKFEAMTEFAAALPRLRRRLGADLKGDRPSRDRVLAGAVRLLDLGLFRIGSERYAEENKTYGVATIKKSHVKLNGSAVEFDFDAKGSKRHRRDVTDSQIRRLVKQLKSRRGGGDELLAYKDGNRWRDVSSTDVNDHIKELTEGEFSAKDFRTWNATVLAATTIATLDDDADKKAARKRVVNKAVKHVAGYLDNTPAVCRGSYIDPRVIDRYIGGGETISPRLRSRDSIEKAVLELVG